MKQLKLSPTHAPKNILLITAERLGDTLFLTPAIRLLKQCLPETKFDILTFSPLATSLFQNNPFVNTVYTSTNKRTTKRLINQYPLAINLFHEMLKKIGKPPANIISIHKPDTTKPRAQQTLDFVSSLLEFSPKEIALEYALFPQIEHHQKIKTLLETAGVNLEKDILIASPLGCHRVARRGWKFWDRTRHQHKRVWPVENYVELAKKLKNADPNIKLILTGAPSERYIANMFLEKFPNVIDLIGKTNAHELTALMDLLKVLVTHDTGTLHIACARKIPIVAMYLPELLNISGPFPRQPQHSIICKPSISEITVQEVYESTMKFITE